MTYKTNSSPHVGLEVLRNILDFWICSPNSKTIYGSGGAKEYQRDTINRTKENKRKENKKKRKEREKEKLQWSRENIFRP